MASKADDNATERYFNGTGEERIKMFIDPTDGGAATRLVNPKPHYLSFFHHLAYHSSSATPTPRATFLYTVQRSDCNGYDTLSGGVATTLLDTLSTLPICHVQDPNWLFLGVSRTLTMTFLRPVKVGETVRIECEILGIGKSLATVRAVIRSEKDGGVMVSAEHGIARFVAPKM